MLRSSHVFTNQEVIYNKLLKLINPFSSLKVVTLSGKSGIGKSFVVEQLMNEIKDNYSCPVCYISGDSVCQNRDYYCIKQALNEISLSYEKEAEKKKILTKSFEDIPYAGSIITKLVSNRLYKKELEQQQKGNILSEEEMNIIYHLNYLFDKRSALIICDNIQYFDCKSLELLYILISSKDSTFNFFEKCQFLIIHTENNQKMPLILQKIFDEQSDVNLNMSPIDFDDLENILEKFQCKYVLDKEIKKIIFKLSDGHLEIIKQAVSQINDSSLKLDVDINDGNSRDLLEELVAKKLEKLGASGDQISQLLEYASLIGKTFSNEELSRIVELNSQDFFNAIKHSNEMAFILSEKKYSNFSHDIIQLLFRKRANKNIIHYYQRMQICIKELTPAEYKQRIDIEINLGNFYNASILIVLLCAKTNYNYKIENQNHIQILSFYPNIEEFLNDMYEAYEKYKNRNYQDAINIMNSIDNFLPVQLLAERDILKSISLTKLLREDYRLEAVRCLENYTLDNLDNEGDLYLRIQLSLISSYSHTAEIEKAKKCEMKIFQYLQPRLEYDENARLIINILQRKANSLHACIYAEKKIKKSVQYFAPLSGCNSPLNPIQYLMSLANYAGILIECGRFSDAYYQINKAQHLIQDNTQITFPRTQIIDNNYLLSLYLMGNASKEETITAYEKLVDISQNADNIFIVSNYCSLLAANGHIKKAYNLLMKKYALMQESSEPFYEICMENNLLIINLFYKEYDKAQKLLDNMINHINGILDESYYRKKYELLQYVINEKIAIPIEKIDTFLFDLCPNFQEAWAYWGRSFAYTALYYWSDM